MPSLTHILIFSDQGWKKITASEAAKQFPGTVQAESKIFMCELCHQYATLTKPGEKTRHFRHGQDEDKSCPERTFSASANTNCSIREHDLPIRLKVFSYNFMLEMGLLGVSGPVLKKLKDQTIQIGPARGEGETFSYNLKERLQEDQITYVSIGSIPFREYRIQLSCRHLPAFSFWPERIRGIDPKGTLFDAASGKKIPYDADIQAGKPYYLLRVGHITAMSGSVSLREILRKPVNGSCWYLYEASADVLDKSAAEFFLALHCRLTDRPISIQPIWPIYTKSPYVIHHNSQEMVFYVRGDVTTMCYPKSSQRGEYIEGKGRLEFIRCAARQQLISVGHDYHLPDSSLWRRLKYTYLWQEPLNKTAPLPIASITDLTGRDVSPGVAGKLPPQGVLRISVPHDGFVAIRKGNRLVEKRRLKAETPSEITSIQFGVGLEVFQGLDCVWSIQYQRERPQAQDETQILRLLKSAGGPSVPIPHAAGASAKYLENYPQIKQWLYQSIREGTVPARAYHEFKSLIKRLAMK